MRITHPEDKRPPRDPCQPRAHRFGPTIYEALLGGGFATMTYCLDCGATSNADLAAACPGVLGLAEYFQRRYGGKFERAK